MQNQTEIMQNLNKNYAEPKRNNAESKTTYEKPNKLMQTQLKLMQNHTTYAEPKRFLQNLINVCRIKNARRTKENFCTTK